MPIVRLNGTNINPSITDGRYHGSGNLYVHEVNAGVTLEAGGSADSINGSAAGNYKVTAYGGGGNDTIMFGYDCFIDGEGGNDLIGTSAAYNMTVYGGGGLDTIRLSYNNDVYGGSGDDSINCAGGGNFISGDAGADTIRAGTGTGTANTIIGGAGNDFMNGGIGLDRYVFDTTVTGIDTITDDGGNADVFHASAYASTDFTFSLLDRLNNSGSLGTNTKVDTLRLTAGSLIIDIHNFFDNTTILAATPSFNLNATGDGLIESFIFSDGTLDWTEVVLKAFPNLILLQGTSGNDTLTAANSTKNHYILGYAGNDTITGQAQSDTFDGGDGNDTYQFLTGWGADTIIDTAGSGSIDTLDFSGISTGLTVKLAADTVSGAGHDEVITGTRTVNWLTTTLIENVIGGSVADNITGNTLANVLQGGGGADTIAGGDGNDTLDGGASGDNITGGIGVDTISGGNGNDTIDGGAGNDTLDGGSGNDSMVGGAGDDLYFVDADGASGDTINETVSGSGGVDTVFSSVTYTLSTGVENLTLTGSDNINAFGHATANDNNILVGNSGNNSLDGGVGNDTLDGGSGNDILLGGNGADTFKFDDGFGSDTVDAGSGTNTLDFTAISATGVTVNLVSGGNNGGGVATTSTTDGIANIMGVTKVIGSGMGDDLTGTSGADAIDGGDDHDVITGSDGNDSLLGGNGNDTITGGSGNDNLDGGNGNDTFVFSTGWGTDPSIAGGAGTDILDFSAITVNITGTVGGAVTSTAGNVTAMSGIEAIYGGQGADTLNGSSGIVSDTLRGGLGNDSLAGGRAGDTYLYQEGDTGSDIINDTGGAASGDDVLDLSPYEFASFTITAEDSPNPETGGNFDFLHLVGNGIDIKINSFFFNNTTVINSLTEGAGYIENIIFSDFTVTSIADLFPQTPTPNDDTNLRGTPNNDMIDALAGNDTVTGLAGDDSLIGNIGNDSLNGEAGDDILIGGAGNDRLNGGDDNDTYQFTNNWGNDTITADSSGSDTLDLSATTNNLYINLATGNAYNTVSTTTEFRVNNNISGTQAWQSVTPLSDGGFAISWANGNAGKDTFAKVYGADGNTVANDVKINVFDDIAVRQVVQLDNGQLFYSFATNGETVNGIEPGNPNAHFSIVGKLVNSNDLTSVSGNETIKLQGSGASSTEVSYIARDMIKLDNGNVVAAYSTFINNVPSDIKLLQFNSTGGVVASNRLISSTGASSEEFARLAALPDTGGFVATWTANNDVWVRRFNPDGTPVGGAADVRVNTTLANTQQASDVTAMDNGRYMVVWQSFNQDAASTWGIYGRIFNSDGTNFKSEFAINTTTAGEQGFPTLTTLDNGNVIVAWQSNSSGSYHLYGQYYDSNGNAIDGEFQIDTLNNFSAFTNAGLISSGAGASATLAALPDGGFIATWWGNDGNGLGIYAQRFDADGNKIGPGTGTITMPANTIENAIGGSGNDTITGNGLANSLDGSGGNDTLSGADGNDTLVGGTETDSLTGGDGNDSLDGGTGIDTMAGGTGDDTYVLDSASDSISENTGEGTDTVKVNANYTLATNFENLTLTGTGNFNGQGTILNNIIIGNDGNNTLDGNRGNDTIYGGLGNDSLTGSFGNVFFDGGDGNDTISGCGLDTLFGGRGDDRITAGLSSTSVDGGEGNDNIIGSGTVDTLQGGDGNDTINAGTGGNDIINGGLGNDSITGNHGNDRIDGGAGADTLDGLWADDTVLGGDGDDTISDFMSGNDSLVGGNGADTISVRWGDDTLVGGDGDDVYIINNFSGNGTTRIVEGVEPGNDTIQVLANYTLDDNVENLILNGGGDWNATGNTLNNSIKGNGGSNSLTGDDGNDTLVGGAGNDTYLYTGGGDLGTDVIADAGSATTGSFGTDTVSLDYFKADFTFAHENMDGDGNRNDLVFTGITGNDTVIIIKNFFADNFTVNPSSGQGVGFIETIRFFDGDFDPRTVNINDLHDGNDNPNTIADSNGGNDTINGAGGNDSLSGGIDDDIINGGDGGAGNNDTLDGGAGNDTLNGEAGNDVITGGDDADTINGGSGNDVIDGGTGADTITGGDGLDTITGGDGADTIDGGTGNDTISGGNDNDLIYGGADNDTLDGGSGNDTIYGEAGNDSLIGGIGDDSMMGGAGDDIYVVGSAGDDVIEIADEGTDTVQADFDYTLDSNVENLTLTGSDNLSGTGNTLNNSIIGNTGNNTLSGGDGNDTLDGSTGNDRMIGGINNDVYIVDSASDSVLENASEGTDTVQTGMNYTLGSNVENLTLTGSDNLSGTGNSENNALVGNTGNNTLTGDTGNDTLTGGTGNDSLLGGTGNDTYLYTGGGALGTDIINDEAGDGDVLNLAAYTLADLTFDAVDSDDALGMIDTLIIKAAGLEITVEQFFDDTVDEINELDDPEAGPGSGFIETIIIGSNTYTGYDEIINILFPPPDGNDLLNGDPDGPSEDTLDGLTGNDTINGFFMNDTLTGGTGNDEIDGGAGDDVMMFGANFGNDTIIGGLGKDTLNFSGDTAAVTANLTTGTATDGTNTVTITSGIESLVGTALADSLTGDGNSNTLTGGGGNDTLSGGSSNDTFVLADGFATGTGDTLDGGSGVGDILDVSALTAGVTFNMLIASSDVDGYANVTLNGAAANFKNIESVIGTGLADNITGDAIANTLIGGGGNDTLDGGKGNDRLEGGIGHDTLVGGSGTSTGNDTILGDAGNDAISGLDGNDSLEGGDGNDTLLGGDGDDKLIAGLGDDSLSGDAGNDTFELQTGFGRITINGGAGADTVDFTDLTSAMTLNLTAGSLTSSGSTTIDSGLAITAESFWLSNFNDVFVGDTIAHTIKAGAGNDTLSGGDSSERLDGGTGNDTINGGNGIDTIFGEGDNDSLTGGAGNDSLNGGTGNDTLNGSAGNDNLKGEAGNDVFNMVSGFGNDVVNGGDGNDTLDFSTITAAMTIDLSMGSAKDGTSTIIDGNILLVETVLAGSGDDSLIGDSQNNNISGNDGHDTLRGGLGNDTLLGGSGNDRYRSFTGNFGTDIINDVSGTDVLDLSNFATTGLTWTAIDTDSNTFIDALKITSGINSITLLNYFGNTTADDDDPDTIAGTGAIESIIASNDADVTFDDILALVG